MGGATTQYVYDELGNLVTVALPNGTAIEYVIDGLNRRVGKKVNGTRVEGFLYDGRLRPVAWLDGAGNVFARFVYGTRVNVPEYMTTASGTFRVITDHLGSPRLVVNTSTGAVAQRVDYDEWGQVLADTAPGFQPFGFAGGLWDRDTGLVRFGARDYDPSVGRWTNKDRSRFRGGLNLYAYVGNDPVNFYDPRGRMKLPADPSGLGPDWTQDPRNTDPNGGLWRHPSGDTLEFNKGRPGLPGWKGKDHWHHNGDHSKHGHLKPGTEIPDPAPVCGGAPQSDNPVNEEVDEELLGDEADMSQLSEDLDTLIVTLPVILDILEAVGVVVVAF